jgi:hypothetical protein
LWWSDGGRRSFGSALHDGDESDGRGSWQGTPDMAAATARPRTMAKLARSGWCDVVDALVIPLSL